MSVSTLGLLGALTGVIPGLVRLLRGHVSSQVLDHMCLYAQQITGEKEPGKVASTFEESPQLVSQFYAELAKLEHEGVKDRMDARRRDQIILKSIGHNIRADVMVIAAALGLVGCLVALTYYEEALPGEAVGIISTIAGIFGSCLKDAYAFEFGSSRGSRAKDERVVAALKGEVHKASL